MKNNKITKSLNVQAPHRHTQDIRNWMLAIRAFESVGTSASRTRLYDLYEDVILDGQIEACWSKRQDALTNRDLVFNIDGKEDEDISALLQCQDMLRMIRDIVDSRLWGHTLLQINDVYKDEVTNAWHIDYDLIDRKHVHPVEGYISKEQGTFSPDINYKEPPLASYCIECGSPTDKGILVKVAPYVIYKRGGFGDWAQFSEMFGMPFREGVYDAYDQDAYNKLKTAMEEWGSANWMLHPTGTEIKIHDTGSSASSSSIYSDLIDKCDQAIAKIIVGNTLTTDNGVNGSRALGDVHLSEEENKYASDEKFLLSILNTQFKVALSKFGIDLKNGAIWFRSPDKDWNALQTKWNVLQGLSSKLPIDDDYLYEEFDIPKPANYDQLKADEEAQRQAMLKRLMGGESEDGEKKESDDKKGNEPSNSWLNTLKDFFVRALGERAHGSHLTNSASLIDRVWNKESTTFDKQLFDEICQDLLRAVATGLTKKSNGLTNAVTYDAVDDAFETVLEQNIMQFSAAKTDAELLALNEAMRDSDSYSDYVKKAERIVSQFNDDWQRTEYHTAVNAAENASTYRRLFASRDIFEYWEYKTVGDSCVREEHAALDGLILPATDPEWNKIFPPNGWNCRCTVIARMKEEVDTSLNAREEAEMRVKTFEESKEWKSSCKHHFDHNVGRNREIFTRDQFYIDQLSERITADKYGLDRGIDARMAEAGMAVPAYNGSADEWWAVHAIDDIVSFKDYRGRTWELDKDVYDAHTTNIKKKREHRVAYLETIEQTVSNPDEVWLNDLNGSGNHYGAMTDYVMIKYYKDDTIVVCGRVNNENLKISTWYHLYNSQKVIDNTRNGLLVK